ncbi:MAG: inorganic phosphate transporter [Candidatus Manganitrophus sp. SA1]|nr:inorganic phosphate transporter [Candidatus Manganitrophus morganii]
MTTVLWMTVLLLAFANGANDNVKGVATLRGSGLATETVAILWGSLWTFFGALLSAQIGVRLIALFNGNGLLPAEASGRSDLLWVIALASGGTVLIASRIGVPISTTHALTGALIGTGAAAFGIGPLRIETLGKGIVLPLLVSPLLSLGLTLLLFSLLRPLRRFAESCVCLVRREPVVVSEQALAQSLSAPPAEIVIGPAEECRSVAATDRFTPLNGGHWLSAGLMSFSRGLNDTPKIAALLLGIGSGPTQGWAIGGIALAMAVGGILGARRVSQTLSERITPMNPVQGFSANLITALLVAGASHVGMPVSTTHVSCGSLFGIGLLHRNTTDWRLVGQILLAWGITLPLAALLGAALYRLLEVSL